VNGLFETHHSSTWVCKPYAISSQFYDRALLMNLGQIPFHMKPSVHHDAEYLPMAAAAMGWAVSMGHKGSVKIGHTINVQTLKNGDDVSYYGKVRRDGDKLIQVPGEYPHTFITLSTPQYVARNMRADGSNDLLISGVCVLSAYYQPLHRLVEYANK